LNAVLLGGISLLIAAVSVLIVKDVGASKIGDGEFVSGGGH